MPSFFIIDSSVFGLISKSLLHRTCRLPAILLLSMISHFVVSYFHNQQGAEILTTFSIMCKNNSSRGFHEGISDNWHAYLEDMVSEQTENERKYHILRGLIIF